MLLLSHINLSFIVPFFLLIYSSNFFIILNIINHLRCYQEKKNSRKKWMCKVNQLIYLYYEKIKKQISKKEKEKRWCAWWFNPFHLIWSILVHSVYFSSLQSTWSISNDFGPIQLNLAHFSLFRSTLALFGPFSLILSIQYIYLRMGNDMFEFRVLIINPNLLKNRDHRK